jgi:tRNA threonylcarbamoyladenosine biosynthesis protein TsaB
MAYILSIETSTNVGSVALHKAGVLLSNVEIYTQYSHSEKLTLLIEQVIQNANINTQEIEAIAISQGPGSYTGLRIGVATCKGLCFALDKPLLSVSTLASMSKSLNAYLDLQEEETWLCPMLDARRMEVYCALYDKNNQLQMPITAKIIDENSFEDVLKDKKIIFFGNGAKKCKEILEYQKNALFITDDLYEAPLAKNMGELAYQSFLDKDFQDIAYFEPFYLKDFVVTQPKNKS